MKTFAYAVIISLLATVGTATAQDAPEFFTETYPTHALDEALALDGALGGEEAALDAKTRELISLAVAAQIPCEYCVYAHKKNAKAAGASEAEIREAVAAAAMIRHWSTVLNGMGYDIDAFKMEYDKLVPSN